MRVEGEQPGCANLKLLFFFFAFLFKGADNARVTPYCLLLVLEFFMKSSTISSEGGQVGTHNHAPVFNHPASEVLPHFEAVLFIHLLQQSSLRNKSSNGRCFFSATLVLKSCPKHRQT